ncbi:MAG: hypothetical protein NTZ33_01675 [Bacteroidetes bacterium]|nr:hypothetical protein [Bacteroidota bacterium]
MENNSNINWSDLPVHKPDTDLWNRIETELEIQPIIGNIDELPLHNPKTTLWNTINNRLNFYKYARYALYTGIALTIVVLVYLFTDKSTTNKPTVNPENKLTETIKIKENTVNNALTVNSSKSENQSHIAKSINNAKAENEVITEKFVKHENPLAKNHLIALHDNTTKKAENKPVKPVLSKHETAKTNPAVQIETQTNINAVESKNVSDANLPLKEKNIAEPTKEKVNTKIDNQSNTIETNPLPPQAVAKTEVKPLPTNDKTAKDEEDVLRSKLKSATVVSEKALYSIGIDYTYSKIYNAEKFSYSANNQLSQFGISLKYNYRKWIIQTGLNFSSFSDNFTYNSDQQLNQFKTYHYVDSVIYNPQGNIIQYITHPVTINDSVLYQQLLSISRKYTMLNIPLVIGYQLNYGKFSVGLKAGVLCSVIIAEKESMKLPDNPAVSILKIYSTNNSVNKVNWGTILAAEFDYNFTKRLGFSTEPVLQYYFKSLYKEMDINSVSYSQKPYLLGVKFGLYYKF